MQVVDLIDTNFDKWILFDEEANTNFQIYDKLQIDQMTNLILMFQRNYCATETVWKR